MEIGIEIKNKFLHIFFTKYLKLCHTGPATMLRKKFKNLTAKSQLSSFYGFRDLSVHTDRQTDGYG